VTRPDRLILVHGFTQTGHSWAPIIERLGAGVETVAVDAPGHGDADRARGDLWTAAHEVANAGGIGTYVGYSMGARIALHGALADPSSVDRLVLISATAGIDDADERRERRHADEALADSIERDGVADFLDRWLALPLFAGLSPDAAGRRDRLRNTPDGLASSLRHHGTGGQEPLWDRLGALTMPVLVVAGANDPKFVALARRLHERLANSELAVVTGAGHTVHLERPGPFVALLAKFWSDHPI